MHYVSATSVLSKTLHSAFLCELPPLKGLCTSIFNYLFYSTDQVCIHSFNISFHPAHFLNITSNPTSLKLNSSPFPESNGTSWHSHLLVLSVFQLPRPKTSSFNSSFSCASLYQEAKSTCSFAIAYNYPFSTFPVPTPQLHLDPYHFRPWVLPQLLRHCPWLHLSSSNPSCSPHSEEDS